MRRAPARLLAAAILSASATGALAQTLTAPVGQAVRVPIRGAAADVLVGDPKVADVTVISPSVLFVAGRGAGSTNLVVLDAAGRTLFNSRIVVPANDPGQVTIQRGRETRAFFCAPDCGSSAGGASDERRYADAGSAAAAPTLTPTAVQAPAIPSSPPPTASSALR